MKKAKNRGDNTVEYGTISLPEPLLDKIRKKIKGTGMPSISAYVAYILRQVLSEESDYEIRKKLKRLGYI